MIWASIIAGAALSYLVKLVGLFIPAAWFERPLVRRVNDALPVAVLVSLAVSSTFATGQRLTVDHRVVGLAAAVVAIALRAPFVVVVIVAVAASALAVAVG